PIARADTRRDLQVRAAAPVGLQLGEAMGVDGHAHRAVLDQGLVGDRGGDAHGELDRTVVSPGALDRALEVEHDPAVGRLLEVELLDLDIAVARGRLPVYAISDVAPCSRANSHRT